MMFTFEWPYVIALLPLPLLIRWLWRAKVKDEGRTGPELRFPHVNGLRAAFGTSTARATRRRRLLPWLLYPAWALLTVALMRPQIVARYTEATDAGHDLMLAVDLSGSMQSLDFSNGRQRISRLDVAKNVVKDFVTKRASDRVGLVLFGARAYLQAPLTRDTMAVSRLLDNAVAGMAGDATAIGDAIGLAVKNLRERPATSRAIILLTDGEDNASTIPPLQAAKLAKQYGIRIYTIVIGKDGIVPIPDQHGDIVMAESHVDTTLTQSIAELTGGAFYTATDAQKLAEIYDRIDHLEKTTAEARPIIVRKPLYQYPLALGLILLGILGLAAQLRKGVYELSPV